MPSYSAKNPYESPPWKIIAGGKTFYIHAEKLFSVYPEHRFDRWDPATAEAFIDLQGIDIDGFDHTAVACFIEYLYTGSYTVKGMTTKAAEIKKPATRNSNPATGSHSRVKTCVLNTQPGGPDTPIMRPASNSTDFSSSPASVWTPSSGSSFNLPEDADATMRGLPSSSTTSQTWNTDIDQDNLPAVEKKLPHEDSTRILLTHAQVYLFATKKSIEGLGGYASKQIWEVLKAPVPRNEYVGNMVALARFLCRHKGYGDAFRHQLVHNMGAHVNYFLGNEEFQKLMIEDGGVMLKQFLWEVELKLSA
ncbi:uncharacterized protein KY384_003478 [Bacidia gigantensis]|uniref:uncharacterized protein n=1 Tax=Bacidia gigantensis TaxID=2732470 RepID=UPI001D055296|nr:uncharacterized protein KY384_003478 [Bacidia gigantensis]KAG8531842.1 hypothetical protein KY384_003478 [Bacidia gigantensis]